MQVFLLFHHLCLLQLLQGVLQVKFRNSAGLHSSRERPRCPDCKVRSLHSLLQTSCLENIRKQDLQRQLQNLKVRERYTFQCNFQAYPESELRGNLNCLCKGRLRTPDNLNAALPEHKAVLYSRGLLVLLM